MSKQERDKLLPKTGNKKTKKSMAKLNPIEPDSKFSPVVAAFAKNKLVSAGFMMSSYGLKVNGKIFAMYGRDQFVVRLPKIRVDELVESGHGKRFDLGHGRLMKEWVIVLKNQKTWIAFAEEAYDFVKSI